MKYELPVNYNSIPAHERKLVREQYRKEQNDVCPFCKHSLAGNPSQTIQNTYVAKKLFPVGFFTSPIHLHHSHKTGLTIGAFHARCNAVLWQYFGE